LDVTPWEQLKVGWRQGEHLTLIGPTGQGKTTLAHKLLPLRKYVLVVATKPRDDMLKRFRKDGYKFVTDWPGDTNPKMHPKVVYVPGTSEIDDERAYRREMHSKVGGALRRAFNQGGWTIYLDELREITDFLALKNTTERIWLQGRSAGISLVGGTQRPAWVPLSAYSQATHLFIFGDSDSRNLKTLGDISGRVDRKLIHNTVLELPDYHFCYVNTRTGLVAVSKCPK
jgi:energy-coupling factor transporter ATP-binding protein EcfA2